MGYDFSGWATRNDLLCGDGRTIRKDAFKGNDGEKVPLFWNHNHNDPEDVLGHALLENREEGVYAYCEFNDTNKGKHAKEAVKHGDIRSLSIYANKLVQSGSDVIHGIIREVSLVPAGANPGAFIDVVMAHGDDNDEMSGIIAGYDENIMLWHSEEKNEPEAKEEDKKEESDSKDEGKKEETVGDIINSMSEKQQNVMLTLIGDALEAKPEETKGGSEEMKQNVFEQDNNENTLVHSEIIADAIADAKKYGSMKQSFIEHAAINNIENIDYIMPEPHDLNPVPQFIKENDDWVSDIMGAVKHSPFAKIRSRFATLNEEQARAKGYIKGSQKANIALSLLRRTTTPTTVYIKNEIDRDDVVDITDFDVIAWQKAEMRSQLDKELALSFLLGDGRDISDQYKINEQNIRPVVADDDLYTIKYEVKNGQDYNIKDGVTSAQNDSLAKGIIRAAKKARKKYKGSGNPTFYTTEDVLTDLLLIEDYNGRVIYDSVEKLATAMRVKKIVTIPEMEAEAYKGIYGVIVNMNDYTKGADKGGAVSMFDDFDIDYNQMKYLMETRCSGALTVPYSAIVLKKEQASG